MSDAGKRKTGEPILRYLPLRSHGGDHVSDTGNSAGGTEVVAVPTLRSRLFRKYVTLFVLAVGIALLASGMVEVWTSYRYHTAWLIRIQQAQAEAAAAKIGQFI